MTPFEHAQRVVAIESPGGHLFVVSLKSGHLGLPLEITTSAQRADYLALIARQIIANEVAAALRNEDCRLAAEIDQAYLANKIWCPSQASKLCRSLAETHTVELHPKGLHTPTSD